MPSSHRRRCVDLAAPSHRGEERQREEEGRKVKRKKRKGKGEEEGSSENSFTAFKFRLVQENYNDNLRYNKNATKARDISKKCYIR